MMWLFALLPALVGIVSAVAAVKIGRTYQRRVHSERAGDSVDLGPVNA